MSDVDDLDEAPKAPAAATCPGWMATYADMMSLLLCFFILLLTQAEMDAKKFKVLVGSLRMGFGIQSDVPVEHKPEGTSAIAKDFGSCEMDPMSEAMANKLFSYAARASSDEDIDEEQAPETVKEIKRQAQETRENYERARQALKKEIDSGEIELVSDGMQVVIRIREQSSFGSGSAALQKKFTPTLLKVTRLLNETKGEVAFAGHTDDVPIKNELYRSNWDLSSARAVTLAHTVMKIGKSIDPSRVTVRGHGETRPLVKNTSPATRARNRRVEVIIAATDQRAPASEQSE